MPKLIWQLIKKQVGSFGNAATFSHDPGKNLGALGDAGAIVTDDEELSNKMRSFARHGGLTKGDHQIEGINSRMDGLQAAFLLVKMKYLKQWTEDRRKKANIYYDFLKNIPGLVLPKETIGTNHVWHLYVIKNDNRDKLSNFLREKGIATSINYPVALPFLPAYKYLNHTFDQFPTAYSNQSKVLSIIMYPEITYDQQLFVSIA